MPDCCDQDINWYLENDCDETEVLDAVHIIDGSARNFAADPSASDIRARFCGAIGGTSYRQSTSSQPDIGEWDVKKMGSDKRYSTKTGKTKFDTKGGTCETCVINNNAYVAAYGNTVVCKRKAYLADKMQCILQQYNCHMENKSLCFQSINDNGGKLTCPPEYRSQSTPQSQAYLESVCLDTKISFQDWIRLWNGDTTYNGVKYNNICFNALYSNMFSGQSACIVPTTFKGPINNEGFLWAKSLFEGMLAQYLRMGGTLTGNEASEGNTQLNDMIYTICSNTPGLCSDSLFNYCSSQSSQGLANNPEYVRWCGCYLQPDQYSKYTSLYGIPRECCPTCNMKGTVPLPSPDGITAKVCMQSSCIIDDITINISNSTVGGINFSQACNSCSAAGSVCTCLLSDISITAVQSNINNINLGQNCSATVCYGQSNGVSVQVPCTEGETTQSEIDKQSQANKDRSVKYSMMIIVFIFVVVIVGMICIWFYVYPKNTGSVRVYTPVS